MRHRNATATIQAPGEIRSDAIYSLTEFKQRTGLGTAAMRVLRREHGLRTVRIGNRRFVSGAAFAAVLEAVAKCTTNGHGGTDDDGDDE